MSTSAAFLEKMSARYRLPKRGRIRLSKIFKRFLTPCLVDRDPGPALAATSQQTGLKTGPGERFILCPSAIKILNFFSTSQFSILPLKPTKHPSGSAFALAVSSCSLSGSLFCSRIYIYQVFAAPASSTLLAPQHNWGARAAAAAVPSAGVVLIYTPIAAGS